MKYKKTLKYVALICCAMMIGGTYTNAKVYLMKDNKIVGAYYDSEVDRLTFEMPKDAEVEFRAQNFRGTYYGDKKSPGIANYNFFLSDVGLGRGGWMLPYGQYYRINLFGDVADQNEPLRVPDGEYVFAENTKDEEGNDTPVRDKGTFSDYSSRYFETIDGGKTEVNQRFTEGILKVFSKSGGVQVFDLEVTTEDGVKHHVVYEGVTSSFDDESGKLDYIPMDILSEDVTDLVLTRSDAMYYGTDNGVSSLWLQFFDMDVDRNGFPVPPGNKLDLVVTSPEIRGNHLPAGKYRISADGTVYTIEPGSKKVEFALEVANGSYISVASSATDWKYGIFDGGEMTVTEDEDGTHHISFDFKMGDYYWCDKIALV